jgi:hypothetical protein
MATNPKVDVLNDRRLRAHYAARDVLQRAEDEGRDLSGEERAAVARAGDPTLATQATVYRLTHSQLEHFWQETGVLPEDVRHAAFLAQGPDVDRTAPWATGTLSVDGQTTAFKVLAHEPFWVGQAVRGGVVIGIRARHWNISDTGLVTVRNTNAYADGTRTMHRRWRRPAQ